MNITSLLPPVYYPLHNDIKARNHQIYRLDGGRASLKSTVCATEVLNLMLTYSWVCAVGFMKEKTRLRQGIYNLYQEVIYRMGIQRYFDFSLSPLKITYLPTGQFIIFLGLDDPFKTKGISTGYPNMYFAASHFEELDQFNGIGEVDTALESLVRCCPFHWCFQCFNPPENRNSWVNNLTPSDDVFSLHTDYRQVPTEWLGEPFYRKMRELRKRSEKQYQHRYLGIPTSTGSSVFENITQITLTDDVLNRLKSSLTPYNGQDWGYYPDPAAFTRSYYDDLNGDLYIVAERVINKSDYKTEAEAIINSGYNDCYTVLDSARGDEMIDSFQMNGVLCTNMYKGRKNVVSRMFGIQWLQTRKHIYIDPQITPAAFKEFTQYEYVKDKKTGEILNQTISFNDHTIDSVRYALSLFYQNNPLDN